ncbi:MAG: tetratricopeptide repeat protein [Pyrinomonadaceae bacterium]|nr:tetratricopeptide repeat protein [Pyrinomonadaceae bacterium]
MNKFLILSFAALISIGCNSTANQTTTANTNSAVQTSNIQPPKDSTIVSSHSHDAEKPVPPPLTTGTNKSAASTESPMARPIDVAELTADIEKAEKDLTKNPNAKEELAKAYFVRATALTDAAQYRAALGDYRKGLKLNPKDEDAKAMHDQIISIFQSINREPPKEGEEPKPLAVK